MELYTIDLKLVLWTVLWVAIIIFAGVRIYKIFRK